MKLIFSVDNGVDRKKMPWRGRSPGQGGEINADQDRIMLKALMYSSRLMA